MKRILCTAVSLSLLFVSGVVSAVELSADLIMKSPQGELFSKMYIKADKFRADVQDQSRYHIFRQDRNVLWIVLPESKAYMEIRCRPERNAIVEEKVVGEVSRRIVGTEIVDGRPTVKYEITYEDDNRIKKIFQWMATDINFPVKISAVDGSWSNEYKNIRIGPISDALFEIPAGFEKVAVPEMQV